MHEMALMESVLEIVEDEARRAGATRVTVVRLAVGVLSHVDPEALRFCFEAVTNGTTAAGARLEIDRVAGAGWCLDCSTTVALDERFGDCPQCGGRRVQMTAGDDLRVAELEVV
ncbi:hydrogenase maturation nickel metallochaperone HypA [Siculibacillus lacustris]|uniref:Hydrogenase maturation factor HypA n=1 Tax=Siculibacillus lacustris TaxID=1549641 RepID=A0A4Q9VUX1_9HYPH|nr:hydrogenase maturation nickel metallochaperone HypA [Siculibacillus lacustris]TBW40025.1 hydrogenase maturation nickel metallochaperone HypA [Siculibacillus lacustris]